MIAKLYLTFVPAIGVSIFLLLLIASESLAARPSYYTGGIALPYISDTWRDALNYYLGLVGGIICGACLLVQHAYLNVRIAFACGDRRASVLWPTASVLGALSCVGLLGLTIFSTTAFPDLHQYSAYVFFVLQAIALPLFTAAAALPGDMLTRASIRGGHAHFGAMTKPADTSAYGGAAGAAGRRATGGGAAGAAGRRATGGGAAGAAGAAGRCAGGAVQVLPQDGAAAGAGAGRAAGAVRAGTAGAVRAGTAGAVRVGTAGVARMGTAGVARMGAAGAARMGTAGAGRGTMGGAGPPPPASGASRGAGAQAAKGSRRSTWRGAGASTRGA